MSRSKLLLDQLAASWHDTHAHMHTNKRTNARIMFVLLVGDLRILGFRVSGVVCWRSADIVVFFLYVVSLLRRGIAHID